MDAKNMNEIIRLYQKTNQFGRDHAMELTILNPGEVQYDMKVLEKHLATPSIIHGGVLAAMMDAILGVAALSLVSEQGQLVSTVEFKINYFQPAALNDPLRGIGKVEQQGKRILVSSGEIVNTATQLTVAKGLGTFNAYPIEKSGLKGFLDAEE